MRFLLLFSRQGKLRLQKWFTPMSDREKKKIIREMTSMVLSRQPRSCNFLHWKDLKIIYKRWALPVALPDLVFMCAKTQARAQTAFNATFSFGTCSLTFSVAFPAGMPACISAWP